MNNYRDRHPEHPDADGTMSPMVSVFAVNRILVFLFICLMVLVILLGFLLFPANSLLKDLEDRQRVAELAAPAEAPAGLSAEVKVLKGQMVELLGSSIDSKLRNLEESIRADNVSAVDLGTINDIKNELKILKTYSDAAAAQTGNGTAMSAKSVADSQLLDEFSQVKSLIYISIGSCGLMITAIGGIWLQNSYRLGRQPAMRLLGKDRR